MDLNARVDVNCGRKDGRMDGQTENRMPISHLAKAGAAMSSATIFVWHFKGYKNCTCLYQRVYEIWIFSSVSILTVKTLNIGTPRPATVVVLNIKQFNFTRK